MYNTDISALDEEAQIQNTVERRTAAQGISDIFPYTSFKDDSELSELVHTLWNIASANDFESAENSAQLYQELTFFFSDLQNYGTYSETDLAAIMQALS